MQIYELTSGKRNLKEYDPDRSPSGTPNYATGVGPGVTSQMTVTPSMKTDPQPGPAPQLPAPATDAVTPVASDPQLQVLDAPNSWQAQSLQRQNKLAQIMILMWLMLWLKKNLLNRSWQLRHQLLLQHLLILQHHRLLLL